MTDFVEIGGNLSWRSEDFYQTCRGLGEIDNLLYTPPRWHHVVPRVYRAFGWGEARGGEGDTCILGVMVMRTPSHSPLASFL